MEYKQRTTAPEKDNKYYNTNENNYYAAGVGMPNCTTYAWGRLFEITGKKPTIGLVNACDWYKEAQRLGYKVGKTPKLGSVICWGGAGANPYGHVGIVEQIFFDGSVKVSESAWGGIYWNNGLIARPDDNFTHPTSNNHYPCLGFIYCGLDFSTKEEDIVRCGYIDILERKADESGFNAFTGALSTYMTEEQFRNELLNSDENNNDSKNWHKWWFIVRCYKLILGRYPEDDNVVNMRLHMTKQEIFNDLWDSAEAQKLRNM